MTVKEWEQRNEGRIEGQFRMACLVMKMKDLIDSLHDIVMDTSGIKLAKAYSEYHVPEFGRTEMDIMRALEKNRLAAQSQEPEKDDESEDDGRAVTDEELKPIRFEISDPDDLMKVREFEDKHYRSCRKRYPVSPARGSHMRQFRRGWEHCVWLSAHAVKASHWMGIWRNVYTKEMLEQ